MSTLRTNNIANVAGSASTDVLNVINGSAKAWVNFNGTGTVAIRAGYNVSSITDNGVGDYTVNFTTALADANYSPVFSTYGQNTLRLVCVHTTTSDTGSPSLKTTTQCRLIAGSSSSGGLFDLAEIYASFFR